MISVFDVETSFQLTEDGKKDPSAKNPKNFFIIGPSHYLLKYYSADNNTDNKTNYVFSI